MKEELFLFYREHLEPIFRFISSYLRHYFHSIPLIREIRKGGGERVQYKYFATSEKDLEDYLEMGMDVSLFRMEEVGELDMNCHYIFLGQYDKVIFFLNYLREKGFKSLWSQTLMETDNNKPIWKRRVAVIEAIYVDLITEKLKDRDFLVDEKNEWIEFEESIFKTYQENKEKFKALIGAYLRKDWDLSRINPITVSIILEAIAEYQVLKTDKLVLITQSIKTAKNYCEDEDYKIINAILDNYFRSKN